MAARSITDELLNITVGIKCEAGVSTTQVRALIDDFAGDDSSRRQEDDIVEFLWVKDIPTDRREAFLSALSMLDPTMTPDRETRLISAADIWGSRIEG